MTVRNHLLAAVAAGALIAGFGQTASASIITINPSADGLGGQTAFNTDNATLANDGLIVIDSSGNFTEAGNFNVATFNLGGSNPAPGGTTVNNTYKVFGTFTASGSVVPAGPDVVGTVNTFNVTLYATNGNGTTFQLPTSTAPGNLAGFGITPSGSVITLGSGSILAPGSVFASLGSTPTANLAANTSFTAAPGQAGPTAFFEAPIPFDIDLLSANTANTANIVTSPICTATGCTIEITQGGGTVNFQAVPVPEPASLAIFAVGLLGLGAALRRKSRQV